MEPRLVTAHQAEQRLAEVGVARSQARQVLLAGLAGAPARRGRIRLYEKDAVDALLRRRRFTRAALDRHAGGELPGGLLLLRRFVDVTLPVTEQVEQVAADWDLGLWLPALTLKRFDTEPKPAVVVTVAGFVAACFELQGTVPDTANPARRRLVLGTATGCCAELAEARIDLGRGKQWAYWAPARKVSSPR